MDTDILQQVSLWPELDDDEIVAWLDIDGREEIIFQGTLDEYSDWKNREGCPRHIIGFSQRCYDELRHEYDPEEVH